MADKITYREQLKSQIEKKKRIRKRRIKVYLCRMAFLCFFLLLITGVINVINSFVHKKEKSETSFSQAKNELFVPKESQKVLTKNMEQLAQMGYDKDVLISLFDMSNNNATVTKILNHIEDYPKELLELLSKNPETVNFVKDYTNLSKNASIQENIDISDLYRPGSIPFFLQWDTRWGYSQYGNNYIALSGCGPTCLSMVYVGLTGDTSKNPGVMSAFSEENGFLDSDNNTTWALMTNGAMMLGLKPKEISLDKSVMIYELQQGHPIILSMRPGDFTMTGHFIVISAYENGKFVVHDPNSKIRSNKLWDFDTLSDQIKNLWSFSFVS